MKTSNKLKGLLFVLSLMVLIPSVGFTQTVREALEEYNAGASIIKEDPEKALEHLYRALEISEDLDIEGREAKELAESLIPRAHLQRAMNLYRAKKMLECIDEMEKAQETAEKYFDGNTLERAERIMPQLYNQLGNREYRADNFEEAISYYKKAIEIKSNYPDPLYGLALVNQKQENYEKMLDYLKKTLEVANEVNDRDKAEDSQRKAKNYLLKEGDKAQKAKNYKEAIEFFTKALEFDNTDGTIYFLLAINHSELKNWEEVVENGNLALENPNGLDEAGIYYQLGVAHQNLGNNSEACEAFNNALSGSYRAAAEYQINEVLKCN
ncbi:MAG: tetratricopeptide repeat protein [Bacteroidales bacterium]